MQLVPVIKIGLYNAWLGTLLMISAGWILLLKNKKARKRLSSTSWCSAKEKTLVWSGTSIMFIILIYSIWVPLKLGNTWFYVGLVIFLLGYISLIISYLNYMDSSGNKSRMTGFYNISRNPIYLFTSITLTGVSIASASWIMFLLIIVYSILSHFVILSEERYFLKIYGKTYSKYAQRVRRYFLFL